MHGFSAPEPLEIMKEVERLSCKPLLQAKDILYDSGIKALRPRHQSSTWLHPAVCSATLGETRGFCPRSKAASSKSGEHLEHAAGKNISLEQLRNTGAWIQGVHFATHVVPLWTTSKAFRLTKLRRVFVVLSQDPLPLTCQCCRLRLP